MSPLLKLIPQIQRLLTVTPPPHLQLSPHAAYCVFKDPWSCSLIMLKVNYDLGIGGYENFINLVSWDGVGGGDQLLLSEATSGG